MKASQQRDGSQSFWPVGIITELALFARLLYLIPLTEIHILLRKNFSAYGWEVRETEGTHLFLILFGPEIQSPHLKINTCVNNKNTSCSKVYWHAERIVLNWIPGLGHEEGGNHITHLRKQGFGGDKNDKQRKRQAMVSQGRGAATCLKSSYNCPTLHSPFCRTRAWYFCLSNWSDNPDCNPYFIKEETSRPCNSR